MRIDEQYHEIKRMVKDIYGFSERIFGCALLPETSCEEGNKLLDRAMLIGTLDKHDARLKVTRKR
ncbi:MAG: hypothetical protein QME44_03265 [Thermodesulfobacteriota bacterium]|nr:hypothetical protein [Thermodesulfobacteriota bacterium]